MLSLPSTTSPALLCWQTDASGRLEHSSVALDRECADWHTASPPWVDDVHPDDAAALIAARQAMGRGTGYQCMYRLRSAGGDFRLVIEAATPRHVDDAFAGFNSSLIVMEHPHNALPAPVLHEMRRREERFRSLTRMSSDWFWETDREHRFTYLSDGIWRTLGIEPEKLLGRTRWELAEEPEQPGLQTCLEMVKAWQAFSGLRYSLRSAHDGSLRHVEVAGQPCFEGDLFTGYRGVAHDVTADVEHAAALERANTRLNTVLESIGDAFVVLDEHWCVIYANHRMATLLDTTPGALNGCGLWSHMPKPLNEALYPHFRSELKYGEVRAFEAHVADSGRWLEIRAYGGDDGISVLFHDVTEQRRAERAILRSEARLQEIIDATPGGYFRIDSNGTLREANPALAAMVGCAAHELTGEPANKVFPDLPLADFFACGSAQVIKGLETRLKSRDGTRRYVSINANLEREDADDPGMLFGFVTDITERRRTEKQLEQLATQDPVTGLRNRTFIDLHLQTVLDTAARDETNAVMFVDLDRFKTVNDDFGHEAGDLLLREIADRLRHAMRPGDLIARFGGDEFIVVAHCEGGLEAAERIAEKLCTLIAEPVDIGDALAEVGASIGIALAPQDGTTVDELFRKADAAMYKVKASGRNGWRHYEPGDEGD